LMGFADSGDGADVAYRGASLDSMGGDACG